MWTLFETVVSKSTCKNAETICYEWIHEFCVCYVRMVFENYSLKTNWSGNPMHEMFCYFETMSYLYILTVRSFGNEWKHNLIGNRFFAWAKNQQIYDQFVFTFLCSFIDLPLCRTWNWAWAPVHGSAPESFYIWQFIYLYFKILNFMENRNKSKKIQLNYCATILNGNGNGWISGYYMYIQHYGISYFIPMEVGRVQLDKHMYI